METSEQIRRIADPDPARRTQAAQSLFMEGVDRISTWLATLEKDAELRGLLIYERFDRTRDGLPASKLTVGIAVMPGTFQAIRMANGSPVLADAPSDQDVAEFELEFAGGNVRPFRLDILTTKAPGGNGTIARFLEKFGEGIQQVEIDVTDVDRATEILRTRFKVDPIYPATCPGANGTRVNFFLVPVSDSRKVLVELVEQPKSSS